MIIEGYEIDELSLKRGGMAEVFRGKRQDEFQPRALKRIRPKDNHPEFNAALCNRFIKELQVIGTLNHRNIVRADRAFTYVDERTQIPYTVLVMEWLDGLDLQEYVQKKGAISDIDVITKIGKYILEALSYAHKKGVLHMDVKPSNVFRTRDGYVKLIDFGIARVIGEKGENIEGADRYIVTEQGESSFRGTEEYASPEQRLGENISIQSDIFSFGKTMRFLLTGNTNDNIAIKDSTWSYIVTKCTQLNPRHRFNSCDEILQYIENESSREDTKICINERCKRFINKNVRFCPFCGQNQEQVTPPPPTFYWKYCPNCNYEEKKTNKTTLSRFCPNDGYELKDGKRIGQAWGYNLKVCPHCGYSEETRELHSHCSKCGLLMETGYKCIHCHKLTYKNAKHCIHCGSEPFKQYHSPQIEVIKGGGGGVNPSSGQST